MIYFQRYYKEHFYQMFAHYISGRCKSNCSFALLNFAIWYWNTFLNKCGYVIHHFNVHFSLYVFFDNDLLLAVCFMFILDFVNDTKQKAISRDFFYSSSKWVHKAAETTQNINNTFGPGTANKHTVQWWFKKFCKGDKSLEDEECSSRPSEVDNDLLWAIIEAAPLTTAWKVADGHMRFEANWKGLKLDKWVLHELTTNQKTNRFEVSSSLFLYNYN